MTTAPSTIVHGPLRERSDADLVDSARLGDDAAYAVLWERHARSARSAARAVSPTHDPDDLVSEAFASILSAIRKGGGPREGFRPYLFATIRNIAASWGRRTTETPLDDLDERAAESSVEFAELVADRSVLAQAFRELPARWRTLLWYLEVEGMKPREIAPLLGMSPNAVSALAYRAREGFKVAWLKAHISDPARPEECRWVCELVVSSDRNATKRAERRRLDEHLSRCQACRIVTADIDHVAQKLRVVLLPLVLGGAGALAYTADATPAMASEASGAPSGGNSASGSGEGAGGASGGGAGVASTGTAALRAGVAILAGSGLAVALAVGAVQMLGTPWGVPDAEPRGVTGQTDVPPLIEAPAITLPRPIADDPPSTDSPSTHTPPLAAPPSSETVTPTPTPVPAPRPTPVPTPTPRPTVPVQSSPALLDDPGDLDAAILAPIAGTGVAGASVTLLDETGAELAMTRVDPSGRFAATIPADRLREGMSVRAVQTVPGQKPSQPSAAIGPFALPTPALALPDGQLDGVLSDVDGDGQLDDLVVELNGLSGLWVEVAVDGEWTGNLHELAGEPLQRVVHDLAPGTHVLTARYIDPLTGREGRLVDFSVLAIEG